MEDKDHYWKIKFHNKEDDEGEERYLVHTSFTNKMTIEILNEQGKVKKVTLTPTAQIYQGSKLIAMQYQVVVGSAEHIGLFAKLNLSAKDEIKEKRKKKGV